MTRADPCSRGEIAQCKAKVIPKRADRALAAHNGQSHLVGDAAAIICFESGQPFFKVVVAGYQSVVLRPRQGDGLGASHRPLSCVGLVIQP